MDFRRKKHTDIGLASVVSNKITNYSFVSKIFSLKILHSFFDSICFLSFINLLIPLKNNNQILEGRWALVVLLPKNTNFLWSSAGLKE